MAVILIITILGLYRLTLAVTIGVWQCSPRPVSYMLLQFICDRPRRAAVPPEALDLDLSVLLEVTTGGSVTALVLSSQNKRERHVYITPPQRPWLDRRRAGTSVSQFRKHLFNPLFFNCTARCSK